MCCVSVCVALDLFDILNLLLTYLLGEEPALFLDLFDILNLLLTYLLGEEPVLYLIF